MVKSIELLFVLLKNIAASINFVWAKQEITSSFFCKSNAVYILNKIRFNDISKLILQNTLFYIHVILDLDTILTLSFAIAKILTSNSRQVSAW